MHSFSQFLIAFGSIIGIATWYLFQNTLTSFISHMQRNHIHIWEELDCPEPKNPAYKSIFNPKLRRYIIQKEYSNSADIFFKDMGALLRQRLLFCLFCLACLFAGIISIPFSSNIT